MTRGRKRALSDDAVVAACEARGWDRVRAAVDLGVSPATVHRYIARIERERGPLPRPERPAVVTVGQRVDELTREIALLRVAIEALAARPTQVLEWKPDHTRHSEGGRPVREQRREIRRLVG